MKHYLNLVSEYAKVHKKKNRLVVICISISVMLVTAIFGMADMSIKAQTDEAIRRYGNWHVILSDISDETAEAVDQRKDVAVSGFLGMAADMVYQGRDLVVQSSSEALARQMNLTVTEGRYPVTNTEALLDQLALEKFGLSIGDEIEITFDSGQTISYVITGTFGDFSSLQGTAAHGLHLAEGSLRVLPEDLYQEYDYIQFKGGTDIDQAMTEIRTAHGLREDQLSTNMMLLGLMGESRDSTMLEVYLTAAILFLLVTMAGTFMIASSFNMSILERTQFFGLLRCIGATKQQIKRYIRCEGLQYCIKAIPIGIAAGCMILWAAVYILNTLNSQYLPQMPQFQISLPGVLAGICMGVLVVLIASSSPAKRAANVSPQAAVTGNMNQTGNQNIKKASSTSMFRVDTAMGLRHAFSNKKSMVFISGSFAISIVLFLCFSVLITFMNSALGPLKPYTPDLAVMGETDSALLPQSLKQELSSLPETDKVYGRMFYRNIPASDKKGSNTATLISYDEPQFEWAEDLLISGDIDAVRRGDGVLVDYGYSQKFEWKIDDIVELNIDGAVRNVRVSGIVSDVPVESVSGEWIIICSEKTFTGLTGISDYSIIEMQVHQDISSQLKDVIAPDLKLLDYRMENEEIRTGYLAVSVFVYGFLIVIALVALINIVNTVNASVSSRMNHYGVMRAVGMSGRQLGRVVLAEAAAYAIMGSVTGGVLGLFFHRLFFEMLITSMWGQLWHPPLTVLTVVISAAILTTWIAVLAPTRKIEKTSIMNVVNAG